MSQKYVPAKTDIAKEEDARMARIILMGPVGNWIYECCTKTDFDRHRETVEKMRRNGMKHGRVKLSSKHGGKISTEKGEIGYEEQNEGEYEW